MLAIESACKFTRIPRGMVAISPCMVTIRPGNKNKPKNRLDLADEHKEAEQQEQS
jgi:hypothetical protein